MTHRKVRAPLSIVHSENWLAYSYFNEKVRRTEISKLNFSILHLAFLLTLTLAYVFPTRLTFATYVTKSLKYQNGKTEKANHSELNGANRFRTRDGPDALTENSNLMWISINL